MVLILAIVLPLTLIKKDDPTPPAPPDPPPIIDNYNPYTVGTVATAPSALSGIIKSTPEGYNLALHLQSMQSLFTDTDRQLGVDAKHIPVGVNNQFTQAIRYKFAMKSWRIAHMVLTDDANPSFAIPDNAVPAPEDNLDMRLDMVGFDLKSDAETPFSFSFTDPLDKDNVFLTTEGQSFVMMDKFV